MFKVGKNGVANGGLQRRTGGAATFDGCAGGLERIFGGKLVWRRATKAVEFRGRRTGLKGAGCEGC